MPSCHSWKLAAIRCVVSLLVLFAVACSIAFAADFTERFEDEQTSWQVVVPRRGDARTLLQRRTELMQKSGAYSEQIVVESLADAAEVEFEHELPTSALLDELALSLEFRSSKPGTILALRLVFPRQKNPRTGDVLTALLGGDSYTQTGQWQTLRATANRTALRDRITRLRAELRGVPLQLSDVYVDHAVLVSTLSRGSTEFFIDDLNWTGYAPPAEWSLGPDRAVVQVSATAEASAPEARSKIEMRHDRLLINGRPIVPRFTPHHGEPIDRLKRLGLNVVWIDDYQDAARIDEIRAQGLWAMASPPSVRVSAPDPTGAVEVSLPPFGPETEGIFAWYMGTRIPENARERLETDARLVRAADRVLQRPVIGDIGGFERAYSRVLDGVGLSRHPLQTEFGLLDYRQFLTQKIRLLRPGTFVTSWVQTEVAPEQFGDIASQSVVPVLEPELIRLQTLAAVAAGVQGVGYWKRTAFDADFPGARERELAVAIVNQELDLLEPWLASRTLTGYQRVAFDQSAIDSSRRMTPASRTQLTQSGSRLERSRQKQRGADAERRAGAETSAATDVVEMAVIDSANGLLLLPIWYESGAQYVPGNLATHDLKILVPNVPDTATVWQLSTTQVRSLPATPTAGGVQVTIDRFDQAAFLVVSTDPNWGRILHERVREIGPRSAALWLTLAKTKLERIREIDTELQHLGVGQPDGPQLLAKADMFLREAERSYESLAQNPQQQRPGFSSLATEYSIGSTGPDAVRRWCEAALQAMRILQRAHWEDAVSGMSSPLSSPYTASYQTLPDHWRLIRRIGASPVDTPRNLLLTGNFEDTPTGELIERGWKNTQGDVPGVSAAAELAPAPDRDGSALRLVAVLRDRDELPQVLTGTPISIQTSPVAIRAGQVVHISGRVRVPHVPQATLEGVTLTESLSGARLRWTKTSGWATFELYREVAEDAEVTLTLSLHGLGECWFDNLRIVPTNNVPAAVSSGSETQESEPVGLPDAAARPFDFLKRFRKVRAE